MYDKVIGRFASEDPISFLAGDTNLGRYVGNEVSNSADPDGLEQKPVPLPHAQVPRQPPIGQGNPPEQLVPKSERRIKFKIAAHVYRDGHSRAEVVKMLERAQAIYSACAIDIEYEIIEHNIEAEAVNVSEQDPTLSDGTTLPDKPGHLDMYFVNHLNERVAGGFGIERSRVDGLTVPAKNGSPIRVYVQKSPPPPRVNAAPIAPSFHSEARSTQLVAHELTHVFSGDATHLSESGDEDNVNAASMLPGWVILSNGEKVYGRVPFATGVGEIRPSQCRVFRENISSLKIDKY